MLNSNENKKLVIETGIGEYERYAIKTHFIQVGESFDEVIEKANDCIFGLTSSIYSTNWDTIMRALNELHYGETYVNREHFEAFQGFHAGVRQSGLGGDDGELGLEEFLETHVCYVDYDLNAQG